MNIPFHRPYITDDEINAVSRVLRSGWLTMGSLTFEFERSFKEFIGASHTVAVNSATAGLHLALAALGLKRGDEVLIPAMTFVATAEVVCYFGAVPVLVDVERDTHLMDLRDAEGKITPRTRAIIPVHYGGQMCDMDGLDHLARRYDIEIIEDAAHALPAWYRDRMAGSFGNMCCFSFYATKPLSTGEGGMIALADGERAEKMRSLRLHGISKDAWNRYADTGSWGYDVTQLGYKYNMTDISAALGIEQLKKVQWMHEERCRIADEYNRAFAGSEALIPYTVKVDRISAWHLYPVKINPVVLSLGRDGFIEELKKRSIGVSVHFIPLYRFSFYRDMGYKTGDFPGCEWIFERCVSLPIYPGMGDSYMRVIEAVLDIVGKNKR